MALNPKIDNPFSANHFRPICLCLTIYKVISKILTNRLKEVLGQIIHPLQGAFVPDHLIQDNILIAHKNFQFFKTKSGSNGWIAIKLDMEKTYDIDWSEIIFFRLLTSWVSRLNGQSGLRNALRPPLFQSMLMKFRGISFPHLEAFVKGILSPLIYLYCVLNS